MELKTKDGFILLRDTEYQAVSTLAKQVPELRKCVKIQINQIDFNNKTPEQKNSLAKFRRVLGEVQGTLNVFNQGELK